MSNKHNERFFLAIMLVCGILCNLSAEILIPAYVDVKFSTNINVSKVEVFHENVGAVEFVFQMAELLYKAIDALPEDVTAFSIDDFKISAPKLQGSENVSISVRMGYKKPSAIASIPLFHATGLSSTQFKDGNYSIVKEPGYSGFNTTFNTDINADPDAREFRFVLFEIKVKIDGADAALIDLSGLDLQLDLNAKVTTKVEVIE